MAKVLDLNGLQYFYGKLKTVFALKGEVGVKGEKGDPGTPGTAATITVGTVTSGTTAKVTNRGTANAAIFDFVLPKGDKGDAGGAANVESITNGEIDAFVK